MHSLHMLVLLGWLLLSAGAQYVALPKAEGLSPRYYLGTSPDLLKRQSGFCAAGQHSCLDINATECCANTKFCVIATDYSHSCCELGSDCGIPCPTSSYLCQTTQTINGTLSASPTCCARACSASSFRCAASFGGGCCPYGFACQEGGKCSSTIRPTATEKPTVGAAPSGCMTSQITCGREVGGGCCGVGQTCTVVEKTNYCAAGGVSAVRTGPDGVLTTGSTDTQNHSGLSTGAKAGIGGGIAGLAFLVICGVLYFCVLQRRRARGREVEETVPSMSQTSGSKFAGSKKAASAGTRPSLPHTRRKTADYFGPNAEAGPYTDASPANSPGYMYRGVPISPQSPRDIAVPVEIYSTEQSQANSPGTYGQSKRDGISTKITELPG